jgi:hypothetical protein
MRPVHSAAPGRSQHAPPPLMLEQKFWLQDRRKFSLCSELIVPFLKNTTFPAVPSKKKICPSSFFPKAHIGFLINPELNPPSFLCFASVKFQTRPKGVFVYPGEEWVWL